MNQLIRYFSLFSLLAFFLSGCANRQVSDVTWPENMPPRAYFVKVYNDDKINKEIQTQEEYLTWVVRFYQGSALYRRGWIKMTNELLEQIPNPNEAKVVEQKIAQVGRLVAGEWAKKSDTRTIYLSHVSVWGNALLESLDRNDALSLIERVNKDVEDLLARRINKDTITAERYYPQDEDNPFL